MLLCAALADEALTALETKTKEVEGQQSSLACMEAHLARLTAELEQASEQVTTLTAQARPLQPFLMVYHRGVSAW